MKFVFIGDIHGKWESVEEALSKEGKKIFVGDFIDSYDRSLEDHKKCFELVLEAIKRKEAQSIFGNHELSYLMPSTHRCSGYDPYRAGLMEDIKDDLLKHFKPFIFLENTILVTHAGLTQQIWEQEKLSPETLEPFLEASWKDQTSPVHWIGRARGGRNPIGGIFWCDFNMEFLPIPELTQVFGHTRGREIRQSGQSFCIDCLDCLVFSKEPFLEMEIELSDPKVSL